MAKVLAVLFALSVWQVAALLLGHDLLLVSPVRVVVRLGTLWRSRTSGRRSSSPRADCGWLSAGPGHRLRARRSGRAGAHRGNILWPFVITAKAVPVASFIIISLIWLSSRQLSVFISFSWCSRHYLNVLQGIRSADKQLLEMASVFHVPWRRRLPYIYLPQIRPFLTSACSVSWACPGSGYCREIIGIPTGSIGEKLYSAKVYLNTAIFSPGRWLSFSSACCLKSCSCGSWTGALASWKTVGGCSEWM